MQITEVRAVQPFSLNAPKDWRTSLGQILVIIETDGGITGYGVGGGGQAGIHVVKTVLRDLLLGRDPKNVEEIWREMYRATLPFGRKGLAIMALSGVDLALWDIRGKAEAAPVARLLSEKITSTIPVYLTVWNELDPDQAASIRAVKLHVTHPPDDGETVAETVISHVLKASKVAGSDCRWMLDGWMQWDVETTLTIARELKKQGLLLEWIEEPIPIDEVAGYRRLMSDSPFPIAGGEHEFTAYGFRDVLERKLHSVLQPDVCWCGGMTELVKIYQLAKEQGVRVCPHRGAELWGLHALAALDPQPLAESGRPWMTWVSGQPPVLNGEIRLPEAPGFGVDIDMDSLKVM